VVLQGANIPASAEAEAILQRRGILSIPDIVANAGGLICASVEYRGRTKAQAFAAIEEKVRASAAELLERVRSGPTSPRVAAEAMARERLGLARGFRRRY
jgi:glutamate dehydrogenase (NAD(P)+)